MGTVEVKDTVEVKLLNYRFLFRFLTWREEFKAEAGGSKDRLRVTLSRALTEISGLKVPSPEDAMRILKAIPSAVIYRAFLIYKNSAPAPRLFKTVGLYRAPEPSRFVKKIQEAEADREQIMDRVEQEMEAKFGRQELAEARKLEREMLKNSQGRGLTPASPEGPDLPPEAVPETAPKPGHTIPQRPINPKSVRKYV